MNITSQIESLRQLSYELLHLGVDGAPIYSDRFCQLNKDVLAQSDTLFAIKATDLEEEATICLTLLNGYNATIYDHGDKEQKKQALLDRSWSVLDQLPASLLKCQLLVACYGEVFEEELAKEAHSIINSWDVREFTEEEKEIIEMLKNLEENQYPNSEME